MCSNFEKVLQAESKGKKVDSEGLTEFKQDTILPIHTGDRQIMTIDINPANIDLFPDPSSMEYYKRLYLDPTVYFKLTT